MHDALRRPAFIVLTAALALFPLAALAQTAPPAASDAMHGDAMHGDAMHGGMPMTPASYMKNALSSAQADLAMQKEAMGMHGDARTVALAKKRAADDAAYIHLITIAMQAEHIGN
jgi:hypothetical protein